MNKTKAKSAISLGISALIVIALILIVGLGLYINSVISNRSGFSIGPTEACTASGVQCGRMEILAVTLIAPLAQNATSYSLLNITIATTAQAVWR